jgi:predicted metal-dependent hydrolase
LEKWYRAQAKKHFEARLPLLADLVNRDVTRVSIRDQRSRWGSCSSRRTISLNWRLIQTPDWVSDYVIYHELAHLTHMNHSKAFWTLVESYQPEYKKAERWLKDHHALLQF